MEYETVLQIAAISSAGSGDLDQLYGSYRVHDGAKLSRFFISRTILG